MGLVFLVFVMEEMPLRRRHAQEEMRGFRANLGMLQLAGMPSACVPSVFFFTFAQTQLKL